MIDINIFFISNFFFLHLDYHYDECKFIDIKLIINLQKLTKNNQM